MTQLTATFTVTIRTKPDGDYYFDHDDLVRNVVPWIEGGLDDRDDIAEVTITEQPAAVSAAVAPPTNQAELRDRIRRAICEAEGFMWNEELLEPDEYGDLADAVLAVLPEPTDRAAVRAQAFDEAADMLAKLDPAEAALAGEHAWKDAAGLVRHMARQERRMADEGGGPAGADSLAHSCTNCEGADPDTCLVNPDQRGTPAAFLAWAADVAEEVAEELRARHEFERSTGAYEVMDELRRMADETATETPTPGPFAGGSYLTAEHDTLGMIAARYGGDPLAWEIANPWVTSRSMPLPAGLRVAIPADQPAAGARQDGAET